MNTPDAARAVNEEDVSCTPGRMKDDSASGAPGRVNGNSMSSVSERVNGDSMSSVSERVNGDSASSASDRVNGDSASSTSDQTGDQHTSRAPRLVAIETAGCSLHLEYQWIAPGRQDAPLLVFLHEGLGSLAMWKDWPARACGAAACRGLVYSRQGYGRSTPRPAAEKWSVDFMHRQARELLPALLEALGVDARRERVVLVGHSDGASIALLYAAMYPDAVAGVVAAAPHIFVEDITVANIERARDAYLCTDLRDKLGRYHDDVDSAFWGWNDVWLDPAFRAWNIEEWLPRIACPVLALQGEDDEYGTLAQIDGIARQAPRARALVLANCRHSPHRDQPDAFIGALKDFVDALPGAS